MTKVKLVQSKKLLRLIEVQPDTLNKAEKSNSKYKGFSAPDRLEKTGNRSILCLCLSKGIALSDIVDASYPEACRIPVSKQEFTDLVKKTYQQAEFLYYQGSQKNLYE